MEQDISAWASDEVVLWLEASKLDFCKAEFIRKEINGTMLLAMAEDEIKDLDSIKGNEKKRKQLKKVLSQLPGSAMGQSSKTKKHPLKFGGFGAKAKGPKQVKQVIRAKAVQSDDELDLTPISGQPPAFPPPNHQGEDDGEPNEIYDCVEEMEDYRANQPPPPSQLPPSDGEDDNQGANGMAADDDHLKTVSRMTMMRTVGWGW
eukprot:Em0013g1084a